MLVLARRVNQTIIIGKDIQVTVLEVDGNEVKLGIEAPRAIPILRHEVVQAIKEENLRAIRTRPHAGCAPRDKGREVQILNAAKGPE